VSSIGAATQESHSEPPESVGPLAAGVRSRSPADRFFRGLTGLFALLVLMSVFGMLVTRLVSEN